LATDTREFIKQSAEMWNRWIRVLILLQQIMSEREEKDNRVRVL